MVQSTHDNPRSMISLALEHLNAEVFDALPYGLVVYSVADDEGADFIIEAMNPTATELSQIDVEEAIGQSLIDTFPGVEEMGFVDALRRVYRTGEDEELPPMRYEDAARGEAWFVNRLVLLTPTQNHGGLSGCHVADSRRACAGRGATALCAAYRGND
jgi:PAS domain-containing protein